MTVYATISGSNGSSAPVVDQHNNPIPFESEDEARAKISKLLGRMNQSGPVEFALGFVSECPSMRYFDDSQNVSVDRLGYTLF